ncbi:MAG TPA: hypothetical protein VJ717_15605 [Gemmatimonadaceae bacterium]|nr:hypothetical protein [Gemmatimonadaceae bacterium]
MTTINQRAARVRAMMQAKEVRDAARSADVFPSTYEETDDETPSVPQRRRRRRETGVDPIGVAALMIDDEGVLFWRIGGDRRLHGRRRLRRGVPETPPGEIVELYHYDKLDPNNVNDLLIKKDQELNGNQGLRRLTLAGSGAAQRVNYAAATAQITGKKRRLLFIHGTFSKTEAFFAGMEQAPDGKKTIKTLFDRYEEVLAFDHPTLSVSPVMNAFDLARLLGKVDGPLDIITHSRGGVVTRWLLEGYGMNGKGPYRAVMVGAPLNGTSLASPPRLKGALDVFSNIGTVLKATGALAVMYMPFFIVPLALVRIASSVISVAAKTPIVDGAVAMIPGLHGQSRIANHPELMRLRAVKLATPPRYFIVQSNFETEDPGWKFWKYFRKDKLLDTGADLIFDGPNDLVVDTSSMGDIPTHKIPVADVQDFGTNATVHHTNYFSQKATLDFILNKLTP